MKIHQLLAGWLAAAVLSTLAGGCASGRGVADLNDRLATGGLTVVDAAIHSYVDLENLQTTDRQQQERIKVLTAPLDSQLVLEAHPRPLQHEIDVRLAAYKALGDVYSNFRGLASPASHGDLDSAASKLVSAVGALRTASDIPPSAAAGVSKAAGMVADAIQRRRLREANAAATKLVAAYAELWQADMTGWTDYLHRVTADYADGLRSVPADRFDPQKVAELVSEPFDPRLFIRIYKLNLIEQSDSRQLAIAQELESVGRALKLLEAGHAELALSAPSTERVNQSIDRINLLVGPK
jgi:hypothetical protein